MATYPDENTYWAAFEDRCHAASAEAGQPLDWGRFRYAARAGWDIGAGMDQTVAADKHVAELKQELRLPLNGAELSALHVNAPTPGAFPYPAERIDSQPGAAWWEQFETEESGYYAQAKVPLDWAAFRWAARTGFDIADALPPATSRAKHMRELMVALGIQLPFPLPPTRDDIGLGQTTQQGLTVTTAQFKAMPWWGACWAWLTKEDRAAAGAQLLANGDTICLIEVPCGVPLYDEGGNFYSPDKFPALDMTHDNTQIDTAFITIIEEALQMGFKGVWLFLGGDAGNNGYPIAVAQTKLLGPALAASQFGNLNEYVVQFPGWDGVFYGYEPPEKCTDWANQARAAGAVYVGMEFSTGHIPLGEGGSDYQPGGRMEPFDVVLGEFDDGRFDDSVWQILARMIGPAYVRPPEQPADDDPGSPFGPNSGQFYLRTPSPRGPFYFRVFEYYIYGWVRDTPASVVADAKAYFVKCGATHVC